MASFRTFVLHRSIPHLQSFLFRLTISLSENTDGDRGKRTQEFSSRPFPCLLLGRRGRREPGLLQESGASGIATDFTFHVLGDAQPSYPVRIGRRTTAYDRRSLQSSPVDDGKPSWSASKPCNRGTIGWCDRGRPGAREVDDFPNRGAGHANDRRRTFRHSLRIGSLCCGGGRQR
jgi:hypothetical protein